MSLHKNLSQSKKQIYISSVLAASLLISLIYILYLYNEVTDAEAKLIVVRLETDKLTAEMTEINRKYTEALAKVDLSEKEKTSLMDAVQRIGSDYGAALQDYNRKIVEADTLQKTVSIDDELLSKYSKYYFLNENYHPASSSLVSIDTNYTLNSKDIKLIDKARTRLESMIVDAKKGGNTIIVNSGYRSFKEQQSLKGLYVQKYGISKSNQFSADQGYSEHQLGTTVDITDGVSGLTTSFDKTMTFAWLRDNAHRYGFIMSYPKGNSYYMYEPWHWRYVGVELATYIYNNKLNFYDLEQSYIDTYKVKIFE